jgi:putative flippase GtrA
MTMLDLRFIRYVTVGAANTLAGLTAIFAAKSLAGLDDVTANLLGYALGIAIGFFLNRSWTFEYGGDTAGALARYLCVLLVAYSANLVTVLYAIDVLRINGYLAQAAGVVPYFLVGYVGSRLFAFPQAR